MHSGNRTIFKVQYYYTEGSHKILNYDRKSLTGIQVRYMWEPSTTPTLFPIFEKLVATKTKRKSSQCSNVYCKKSFTFKFHWCLV